MKYQWVNFEHSKCTWLDELRGQYFEKIGHFCPIASLPQKLRGKDLVTPASQLKFTEKILENLEGNDLLVVFDQRGKPLNSESYAKEVLKILESGKRRCFWVTGGAFGLSEKVLERADRKFLLAPFVMSHQIAEAVALEQLYRAHTILKGLPYHNP